MKCLHIAIFAALCSLASTVSAQNFLKNPGFETWTNDLPDSWSTAPEYASKSSIAHGGSFALKLANFSAFGATYPGTIIQTTGVSGSSFSLKGWYQLKADSGDGVLIEVLASNNASTAGGYGLQDVRAASSVYKAFAIGVIMYIPGAADSCTVLMEMEADSKTAKYHQTAYAMFDDLVLDNTVTGVSDREFAQPSSYQLSQNYPNPFNPVTEIEFSIPKEDHVTLKVYNMMGQEVETLVDEQMPQGRYRKPFDGSRLASGMYLYRIEAGSFSQVKRMTLVK